MNPERHQANLAALVKKTGWTDEEILKRAKRLVGKLCWNENLSLFPDAVEQLLYRATRPKKRLRRG